MDYKERIFEGLFHKFIVFIRKVKIQNRLLAAFILASILPILMVSFFSSVYTTNTLTTKISTYSQQLLEQIDRIIKAELMVYSNISDTFAMDKLVQEGLLNFNNIDDAHKYEFSKSINETAFFGNFSSVIQNISILKIYTPDNQIFYDLGYDAVKENEWNNIREMTDKNGGYGTWTYMKTRRGTYCIVLSRRIMCSTDYSRQLGYILIGIDESRFSKNVYSNVNMGQGSDIMLIDSHGTVISGRSVGLERGMPYPDSTLPLKILENEKNEKNVFRANINNSKYLTAFTYDTYAKWYLVATIPYSYINAEAGNFKKSILFISGAFLAFVVVLAFIIYLSIIIPIRKMMTLTGAIKMGDFSKRINDESTDEVSYLADNFDVAVEQISVLIEKVKEEQRMKRKVEIRMLQAQINPHFLFNTLNSLKWTAMISRAKNVSDGIGALSEILRGTILDENDTVTLEEEIKNIESYLVIQKIRYGNMFEVDFKIDEKYYKCRVLKFLLQPIIENSIIHGFDSIDYGALITISCRRDENLIIIEISDNGRGFDTSILDKNTDSENSTRKISSIGIWNVKERIRLNYGEDYGLDIKSHIGQGTVVTVTIPYIFDELGGT